MKIKFYLFIALIISSMYAYPIDQETLRKTLTKKFGNPLTVGHDADTKSTFYCWRYTNFQTPDSIKAEISTLMNAQPYNTSGKIHDNDITTVTLEWKDDKIYTSFICAYRTIEDSTVVLVTVITGRIENFK